jgi:hypothetical protein
MTVTNLLYLNLGLTTLALIPFQPDVRWMCFYFGISIANCTLAYIGFTS